MSFISKSITNEVQDKTGLSRVRMLTQEVSHIKHSDNITQIQLANSEKLSLQPHVYVRERDIVDVFWNNGMLSDVYKYVKHGTNGHVQKVRIYPPYSRTELIYVPPHVLKVTIRERLSSKDWRAAKMLEQFHYRGQGLNKLVGRRIVLVLETEVQGIIGYGVLSATLAATKPRFDLLNTNFTTQMRSKLINQIARISRVVIHPEFRSMGLGVLMAKHLVAYAQEHWDINGYKPIMVEVIASMTKYHNFFQRAGFIEAGSTKGYVNGIKPRYGTGSWESRPNHNDYKFFGNQKPKPYLIYPLTEEVVDIMRVKGLIGESERKSKKQTPLLKAPLLKAPLSLRRVSATYKASNGLTSRVTEIKEAFAVDAEQMYSPILNNFSLIIKPGDVVLFTGASGSGKSTIIKLLTQTQNEIAATMKLTGMIEGINPAEVSKLSTACDENLPLIEQVGESTEEGIAILNSVGLAEAHLYLKRCSQISEGQKYRFAVARLCNSKKPIWIADEFASTLDPQTAAIVARGVRELAFRYRATVVLAAPHIRYYVDSLVPNKLIHLRWGGLAKIYSVKLFCRRHKRELEVWIKNNAKEKLSDVTLCGVRNALIREELFRINDLDSGKSSQKNMFTLSDLHRYSALVINCNEGVGDIFRL